MQPNPKPFIPSPHAPPREVFLSACDELGKHYAAQGKSYAKSSRRISWKTDRLKYEIRFNSSRSNLRGRYVSLEIVPSLWARKPAGLERSGILSSALRPRCFNLCCADRAGFAELTGCIDRMMEEMSLFETKAGIDALLLRLSPEQQAYFWKNPNNQLYYLLCGEDA